MQFIILHSSSLICSMNVVAFDFLGHGDSPRIHNSALYTADEVSNAHYRDRPVGPKIIIALHWKSHHLINTASYKLWRKEHKKDQLCLTFFMMSIKAGSYIYGGS